MNPQASVVWAMFYSGLCSMALHPKWYQAKEGLTVDECAKMADEMLLVWRERFDVCQS